MGGDRILDAVRTRRDDGRQKPAGCREFTLDSSRRPWSVSES
jgi:hypothetical protein